MSTPHIIPELDRDGLRSFGLTTGAIVVVIFGILVPWALEKAWPVWPWIIATPLWALAVVRPQLLRRIYQGWMRFGIFASRITTPLVLGIVFYLVISPVALIWRLIKKDPMQRKFDPNARSYRVANSKKPTERLERPF